MVYYNYYKYYDDDNWDESDHEPALLLTVVAFFAFWFQATVTEEVSSWVFLLHWPSFDSYVCFNFHQRLVPALNVIANRFKIPDHVAGATLMAAGGSSPELFASLVALFVTKSAMGMGTIVGSEVRK